VWEGEGRKSYAWVAVLAAPAIHHFVAVGVGVLMMNSSVCRSKTAVVSMPATFEPCPSSVIA